MHLLNARLAESESMTHDVVRDLLGVKLEVSDYVVCSITLLTHSLFQLGNEISL